MKTVLLVIAILLSNLLHAQELFTYTEPASNMAAKSIGIRATSHWMDVNRSTDYNYQLVPELMWGVSKKVMIHAEGFFSNEDGNFKAEGAALYVKYRFYSQDEVHNHFRLAAFARGACNNSEVHYPAIDLNGFNSGYETGLTATKLIYKLALSTSASFIHAADNSGRNKFGFADNYRDAMSFTFSAGRLILPVSYTDYKQTNLNLMFETLGQWNIGSGKTYIDLAPSMQFIFLSSMRLDLGYRFAVVRDLKRNMNNSFLLRLEYNFFNVYK